MGIFEGILSLPVALVQFVVSIFTGLFDGFFGLLG